MVGGRNRPDQEPSQSAGRRESIRPYRYKTGQTSPGPGRCRPRCSPRLRRFQRCIPPRSSRGSSHREAPTLRTRPVTVSGNRHPPDMRPGAEIVAPVGLELRQHLQPVAAILRHPHRHRPTHAMPAHRASHRDSHIPQRSQRQPVCLTRRVRRCDLRPASPRHMPRHYFPFITGFPDVLTHVMGERRLPVR